MCRSIKTLRRAEDPPTDEEIHAAALQFVRKISGYRHPSRANAGAFDTAVQDVAEASRRLLSVLPGSVRPRGRTAVEPEDQAAGGPVPAGDPVPAGMVDPV